MAVNNFLSYRSRDPLARDEVNPTALEGAGDPLAELARLIGQTDPYAEGGRHEAYGPGQSGDDTTAPGLDWAADDSYAERHDRAQDHYVPPPPPPPLPPAPADSYPSYAAQERGYENEPAASGRYFSGPATKFSGFREDAGNHSTADDAHYGGEEAPVSSGRPASAFAAAGPEDSYEADEQEHDGGHAYAADDYYDDPPSPRRRVGLVVVMAVLGLAVIGTAGAFAYRAMFGGSMLLTLPAIIKASNGPNKIVPSYGDAQASNPSQAGAASAGSTENLVSREEQPVNMEPLKAAPRVVSTIPVLPGQSSAPPAPVAPAPTAAAPASPPPGGASPAPMATSLPPAAAAPAPVSSEPKKIHTVTIRADQSGGLDAAPVPPAPTARSAPRPASPAPKPSTAASTPPAGPNAPLSIIPGDSPAPAPTPTPARTRTAAAPMSVGSAAPVTGIAATPSPGGGYAVQVTSQRSEADAQTAFRALRAKFPNQLSGREPIIRRADLGAKGVYYRALVGPFVSTEEAAGMCSSLKAAGGNCIVQRN